MSQIIKLKCSNPKCLYHEKGWLPRVPEPVKCPWCQRKIKREEDNG